MRLQPRRVVGPGPQLAPRPGEEGGTLPGALQEPPGPEPGASPWPDPREGETPLPEGQQAPKPPGPVGPNEDKPPKKIAGTRS